MKLWLFSLSIAIIIFLMIEGVFAFAWFVAAIYVWCLLKHFAIFCITMLLVLAALTILIRKNVFDDED
jgi:hypothetical protein